ncbi:hypothetical protein BSY18_3874 (plasmid) [Blastomonas sp. RAC04]|uniref:hypothetical protein n=1 Tax=Blastomonas sp. RAC04 TaxID=1842535 RepID=UPI000855F460|nr:hypothetical protein [Blastomonas sp. RAC04]AOG02675.1 hypothetical protein BSY18_3874 [Blastomonas sp. RAC04]
MTPMGHAKAGTPPSDTFEIHLTHQLTLTNLVNEAGLSEIARAAGGDSFVVCDFNTHGVQGCADLRAALDNQKMAAELVAIGLMILVAVLVGTIAAAFVRLMAKRVALPREQCADAFLPLHRGRAKPPNGAVNIIIRKEKRHGI